MFRLTTKASSLFRSVSNLFKSVEVDLKYVQLAVKIVYPAASEQGFLRLMTTAILCGRVRVIDASTPPPIAVGHTDRRSHHKRTDGGDHLPACRQPHLLAERLVGDSECDVCSRRHTGGGPVGPEAGRRRMWRRVFRPTPRCTAGGLELISSAYDRRPRRLLAVKTPRITLVKRSASRFLSALRVNQIADSCTLPVIIGDVASRLRLLPNSPSDVFEVCILPSLVDLSLPSFSSKKY